MNQTNINSELLAESRGRKHIPMAVFAVIMIHVVLFVVLLIAAGCRSKARARLNETEQSNAAAPMEITNALSAEISGVAHDTVIAEEPRTESTTTPGPQRTVQRASPNRPRGDSVAIRQVATTQLVKTYVVKPGDTVGKIAKELGTTVRALRDENQLKGDMIRPGQKLRVTPPKSATRELAAI